jgi:hypothetical protein
VFHHPIASDHSAAPLVGYPACPGSMHTIIGLRKQGIDLQSILKTCTPSYEMEFNVIARFLDDHPDLYMPIIFRNPKTVKILQAMHTIIGEYLTIAHSGNLTDAEKRYEASKLYFKPFLNRARKHSEACIETLLSLKG